MASLTMARPDCDGKVSKIKEERSSPSSLAGLRALYNLLHPAPETLRCGDCWGWGAWTVCGLLAEEVGEAARCHSGAGRGAGPHGEVWGGAESGNSESGAGRRKG